MLRAPTCLLVVAALAAFAAPAPARGGEGGSTSGEAAPGAARSTPAAPAAAPSPPPSAWKEQAFPLEGFAARFPGEATRQVTAQERVSISTIGVERPGGTGLGIVVMRLDGGELPADAADGVRDQLKQAFGAGLVKDEVVKMAGVEGRHLELRKGENHAIFRVLVARGALVQLMAISESGPIQAAEAKAFFDSFRLLK